MVVALALGTYDICFMGLGWWGFGQNKYKGFGHLKFRAVRLWLQIFRS